MSRSYPFCPKCVHYYITTTTNTPSTKPNCSLFKNHPLFKDRPDVDFIGKEICTTDGKYFKIKKEEGEDGEFLKIDE
jgi:hypothetical protein